MHPWDFAVPNRAPEHFAEYFRRPPHGEEGNACAPLESQTDGNVAKPAIDTSAITQWQMSISETLGQDPKLFCQARILLKELQ